MLASAENCVYPLKTTSIPIQSVERPPLEFQRDNVLKPGEIVALSGAKPGMAVVDLLREGP